MKILRRSVGKVLCFYIFFYQTLSASVSDHSDKDINCASVEISNTIDSLKTLSGREKQYWHKLEQLIINGHIAQFRQEIETYNRKVAGDNLQSGGALGKILNFQDVFGNSLLHIAVQSENEECVELLLSKNVDINLQNKDGCTPIIDAVSRNNAKIMVKLLKNGANLNLKSNKENDVLIEAWSNKKNDCARILWALREKQHPEIQCKL